MSQTETWDDMSPYVVHLTRDTECAGEINHLSILASQILRPGGMFGIARGKAPVPETQQCVCFSEMPLHVLGRLVRRRRSLGIGFRKSLLQSRGGGPIWYVDK